MNFRAHPVPSRGSMPEDRRGGATLSVCAHCKGRDPSTRLYRLMGVGLRNLCQPCHDSLDALGMRISEAA